MEFNYAILNFINYFGNLDWFRIHKHFYDNLCDKENLFYCTKDQQINFHYWFKYARNDCPLDNTSPLICSCNRKCNWVFLLVLVESVSLFDNLCYGVWFFRLSYNLLHLLDYGFICLTTQSDSNTSKQLWWIDRIESKEFKRCWVLRGQWLWRWKLK